MSWAEQRDRLLRKEPKAERLPFTPWLPHFVPIGPNRWVETPYATAHCVFCPNELAEGNKIACDEHQRQIDALVMPWERD
jgi:hypothetical protein